MSDVICIYHGNCADGFGAAWVVRKAFMERDLPLPEFYPAKYTEPPPDVTGKRVIMVDFSYKRPTLLEMAEQAEYMIIYDHHATAKDDLVDLPDNVETVFDMARSGAMITWDEQFPDKSPPRLLRHIQDRDLWQWELPDTKEIMAAVFSYPYGFNAWDMLMEVPVDTLAMDGIPILRRQDKDIREILSVATMKVVLIDGHKVPLVNIPHMWGSDACHILCEGKPFAAYYWIDSEGIYNFGMRSDKNGVDVREIAEKFGGGGHKHAAGFRSTTFGFVRMENQDG